MLLLAASAGTLAQASLGSAVTIAGIAVAGSAAPPLLLILLVSGGCVAVVRVQHERFERERRSLQSSAMKDALTGAANRRAFGERIRYEVARHARQEHEFAVVALDLDGFKAVNDRFGHQAGDDLLRQVAEALALAVREQDRSRGWAATSSTCSLRDRPRGRRTPRAARAPGDRKRDHRRRVPQRERGPGATVPEDATSATILVEVADAAAMAAKRLAREPASEMAAA